MKLQHLSYSKIKNLLISPAYFKYMVENPPEQTEALKFGQLYHKFIQTDGTMDLTVFDPDERPEPDKTFASKANKEWKASFPEDAINKELYDHICEMYNTLTFNPHLRRIWDAGGKNEQWIEGEIDGVKFKGIADRINSNFIVDYKTIGKEPTEYAVARAIVDNAYYLQPGVYCPLTGIDGFCLVFQCTKPPYDVQVVMLSDDYLEFGKDEVKRLIALYKSCEDKQEWPGIGEINGVIQLTKPTYL